LQRSKHHLKRKNKLEAENFENLTSSYSPCAALLPGKQLTASRVYQCLQQLPGQFHPQKRERLNQW